MKSDLVEAVLGLGAGLFYNSPMEAVVIILRATKPADRCGKILFINAVHEVARDHAQSFLRDLHQQKILKAYADFADQEGFASVVTLDQIANKSFSLAIPLFVTKSTASAGNQTASVDDAIEAWRALSKEADDAIENVLALLVRRSQ